MKKEYARELAKAYKNSDRIRDDPMDECRVMIGEMPAHSGEGYELKVYRKGDGKIINDVVVNFFVDVLDKRRYTGIWFEGGEGTAVMGIY